MNEDKKVLAARAAQQAKHAAQNSGRAVEAAAEEGVKKAKTPSSVNVLRGANLTLGLSMAAAGISYAYLAYKTSRGQQSS